MYPSQTSLIPVTVALARFLEEAGLSAFFANYPYWYLGSTPFRYLIGPVAPVILTALHQLLPAATLFTITIDVVLFSLLLSAVGWGLLSFALSKDKRLGLAAGLLTLILPWRYLTSLSLDEASFLLARNLVPLVLFAHWKYLKKKDKKWLTLSAAGLLVLLLTNTSILPIYLVGGAALVLTAAFRDGKIRRISKYISKSLFLLMAIILLATIWYTPGYWLTILANPSIGGASGFKVILRILDLFKATVPLVLAIVAVYFSGKVKNRLTVFTLIWILTFGFLTLFRFIGDPDFWTDWTSWFYELEMGVTLLTAKFIIEKKYFPTVGLIVLTILMTFYVYGLLGRPPLLSNKIPEGVKSLTKLAEITKDARVFLSGSTVFWADALYDIYQVRGGRDQVAKHPTWDKAAYELREGQDPKLAERWLKELGVEYVLVHAWGSEEYYHDFRNIKKWDRLGDIVWQEDGDILYKVRPKDSF